MHREVSGDGHRRVIRSMSLLAEFYVGVDRTSEADALLDEIIEKAKEALPEGHWRMGTYLAQHGRCLTKLARYEEAEDALFQAHGIPVESFGAERPKTLTVATALTELYNAWGKPREAAKWSPPLDAGKP